SASHLPHPGPGHLRPRRLHRLPSSYQFLLSCQPLGSFPRSSLGLRPWPWIRLRHLRFGLRLGRSEILINS
ncbi:hypothetical protein IscW_ISCW024571, partial [Ixodes scapularis]